MILSLRFFLRSELDSNLFEMTDEILLLSEIFGFDSEVSGYSPGWQYKDDSPLRKTLIEAYRDVTGREIQAIAVHGGLEGGFISGGIPGIDIVTCGPLCEGYHTTREYLDLKSFREIYEVLKELISRL